MPTAVPTICRACHAGCAVLVDIEDGVPISVKGDPSDPLYRGFCCVKGQSMADVCRDPDRLLHSQKRQPDGSYAPIPVEQAMDEIAARLQAVIVNAISISNSMVGVPLCGSSTSVNERSATTSTSQYPAG